MLFVFWNFRFGITNKCRAPDSKQIPVMGARSAVTEGNKEEYIRDELSFKIAGFAQAREEILAVYLFGSFLQKDHPHDIDIAVLLERPLTDERKYPFGYSAAIATELISLLHTDAVDVVVLNNASPILMMQVLKTGGLLYSRDERARLEQEKRMRDTYIDTAPLRRIKEYYLRRKLA